MNLRNELAVQFANVVHVKGDRYGKAYLDKRIKEIFIGGLPVIIRSGVCIFLDRELEARLLVLAQYANTIPDQQVGKLMNPRVGPRKIRVNEGPLR